MLFFFGPSLMLGFSSSLKIVSVDTWSTIFTVVYLTSLRGILRGEFLFEKMAALNI